MELKELGTALGTFARGFIPPKRKTPLRMIGYLARVIALLLVGSAGIIAFMAILPTLPLIFLLPILPGIIFGMFRYASCLCHIQPYDYSELER